MSSRREVLVRVLIDFGAKARPRTSPADLTVTQLRDGVLRFRPTASSLVNRLTARQSVNGFGSSAGARRRLSSRWNGLGGREKVDHVTERFVQDWWHVG